MENHEQGEHRERHHGCVEIFIDQERHESPNPTTGEALYDLGKVQAGFELYREMRGDREDRAVPNGAEPFHLTEFEHFHSGPAKVWEVKIIVDGTAHEWPKGKITFAQVVTLEFPDYSEQSGINYSVKYTKGPKENPEGVLPPGASVEVKEGMIFHVSRTGQS